MPRRRVRVGLIGFGHIGRQVYRQLADQPDIGIDIAFVHNRTALAPGVVHPEHVLPDLADLAARAPNLVVEMAHPDFTFRWGEAILGCCDYLPLSVTALAADGVVERLSSRAQAHGTRLFIPHGALMGADSLFESRTRWGSVEITFEKNPLHIDFSAAGRRAPEEATVLYDGPVRGIAPLYPRNVNTMVTCALATVGLDRCRARLVARPGLDHGVIRVIARGRDGSALEMEKRQPMAGVSGTEMFESQFHSILRAAGREATVDFV